MPEKKDISKTKIPLSKNSLTVLAKRYLKKNEKGEPIEMPEDLFRRVAHNIASADLLYNPEADLKKSERSFYQLMASLDFIPNSPTLMNAGRDLQQLSACFVLPIEDSIESIFEAVKSTALIHKSGGGTGFSFSRLRPQKARVRSTNGVASGPVSFMKVFNAATEEIKQGGTRRGANMGILRVDHPDIEEFITCKDDPRELTNFNISVALTEKFIKALKNNEKYELIAPHTKEVVKKISAKKIFDKIVHQAWKNGEPGIIFIDRINEGNPTPVIGKIESTNPCGEQPLLPYESCNLGSINLAHMVKDGEIDWKRLEGVVHEAVHFLDNVIDMNRFPLEEIRKMTLANRKIGLGIMGWANMLMALGVPYNSDEAITLAEKVMGFIREEAAKKSQELARTRGAFPNFEKSVFYQKGSLPQRNATLTTIAPTGSISIIADASSGIEPLFAISYVKTVMDKTKLVEVNPYFEKIAKEKSFYSQKLMEKIAEEGSLQGIKEVPEEVKKVFVTAHDITPEWHIKMQAAFQKYTDNAVSKTINFPNEATEEDIRKAYFSAYELGCKGVTVYRDGSREEQVLSTRKTYKKKENNPHYNSGSNENNLSSLKTTEIEPRSRPEITYGSTHKTSTGCGNLYVTVNNDAKGLSEVFVQMGKSGGCLAAQSEAIGRLVSLALRSGIKAEEVVRQIKGIRCPMPRWGKNGLIMSCPDAIAQVMNIYLKKDQPPLKLEFKASDILLKSNSTSSNPGNDGSLENPGLKNNPSTPDILNPTLSGIKISHAGMPPECPECGYMLEFSEGCLKCPACGFSRCG